MNPAEFDDLIFDMGDVATSSEAKLSRNLVLSARIIPINFWGLGRIYACFFDLLFFSPKFAQIPSAQATTAQMNDLDKNPESSSRVQDPRYLLRPM